MSDISLLRLWGLDESVFYSRSLLWYSFLVVSPCCLSGSWCFELNHLFFEYALRLVPDPRFNSEKPSNLNSTDKSDGLYRQPLPSYPRGIIAISQVLWGSIGYSVGACLGAALAAKEIGNRRVILFVGDGSFQMTGQEVSTMLRQKLNPIL